MSTRTAVAPGCLDPCDRGHAGIGRRYHLVIGADAHRLKRNRDRVGAVRGPDRVTRADVRRKAGLELLERGPKKNQPFVRTPEIAASSPSRILAVCRERSRNG